MAVASTLDIWALSTDGSAIDAESGGTPIIPFISESSITAWNFADGIVAVNAEFLNGFFDGQDHELQGQLMTLPLLDVITPQQPPRVGKILQITGASTAAFTLLETVIITDSDDNPVAEGILVADNTAFEMQLGRVTGVISEGNTVTGKTSGASATITQVVMTGVTIPFATFNVISSDPFPDVQANPETGKVNWDRYQREKVVVGLEITTSGTIAVAANVAGERPEAFHCDRLASLVKALYESDYAKRLLGPKKIRAIRVSTPVALNKLKGLETRRLLLKFEVEKELEADL